VNLLSCNQITKHVASNEIVLATLFILVPEALVFLQSKKRHPQDQDYDERDAATLAEGDGGTASTAPATAQQHNYGVV
jgi:hypothetical protein